MNKKNQRTSEEIKITVNLQLLSATHKAAKPLSSNQLILPALYTYQIRGEWYKMPRANEMPTSLKRVERYTFVF